MEPFSSPKSRKLLSGLIIGLLFAGFSFDCFAITIVEARQRILNAQTIEETDLPTEDLQHVFSEIMRHIMRDQPNIAAELVIKTDQLVRNDQATNKETDFANDPGDQAPISEFLNELQTRYPSIDNIAILTLAYRADQQGHIPFSGFNHSKTEQVLYSYFLSLGGNYNTPKASDQLAEQLYSLCGEGSMEYLCPYFASIATHLRPFQRRQMAKWAQNTATNDSSIATIADAMLTGLAIFERAENTRIEVPDFPRGPALDQRLLAILEDENLSVTWRAGMANLMGHQFLEQGSQQLRIACGRVLAQLVQQDRAIQAKYIHYGHAMFLRGDHLDDNWRAAGLELITASNEYLEPHPAFQLLAYKHWLVQLLDLTCKIGIEAQIQAHFDKYKIVPNLYPGMWIHLVKDKKHQMANELFRRHGLQTSHSPYHYSLDNTFSQSLADAMPSYLSTIDDPEERALAELLLLAAPNQNYDHRKDELSTQLSRLSNFDKKHQTRPAWNRYQSTRAFEVFTYTHGCNPITQWIADNHEGIESRINNQNPKVSPYWAARIEMHAAVEQIENQHLFPIRLMWGRAMHDENTAWRRSQSRLRKSIIEMVNMRLRSKCTTNDGNGIKPYLPFCRQILQTTSKEKVGYDLYQCIVHSLCAHSVANEMEVWNDWWASLKQVRQHRFTTYLKSRGQLVADLRQIFNQTEHPNNGNQPTDTERRRIIRQILSTDLVSQSYPGNTLLSSAHAHGFITEQDIYEIAAPIANSAPRQGSAWIEYLGALVDQGRSDDALLELESLISDVEKSSIYPSIEKMLLLKALHRDREAQQISRTLDFEAKLPIEYKYMVDELQKR